MTELVKQLRRGMYCEDCDRIMDISGYSEHNVDHILRPIEWDFVKRHHTNPTKADK